MKENHDYGRKFLKYDWHGPQNNTNTISIKRIGSFNIPLDKNNEICIKRARATTQLGKSTWFTQAHQCFLQRGQSCNHKSSS